MDEYFDSFGFGDMNYMTLSGSTILPILPIMLLTKIFGFILNKIAIRNYEQAKWRKIGMNAEPLFKNSVVHFIKYLYEGFFDLTFSAIL